jgi:hypothetical protein
MSPNTPFFRIACLCAVVLSLLALGCKKEQVANQKEQEEFHRKESEATNRRLERERLARENMARLRSTADEYSRLLSKTQLAREPYLKNKLVILEQSQSSKTLEGKKLDDFDKNRERSWNIYELDSSSYTGGYTKLKEKKLLALSPEEVGTIVFLKFRVDKVGMYNLSSGEEKVGTIPAFQWSCDLTLVDRSIPAIVYKKNFKGEEPEFYKRVSSNTTHIAGPKPNKEIDEFLSNLPQK